MKALAYTLFSVWGYLPRRGSQMCGIVCGTIEKSRLETNISRRFSGIEVTGLEPAASWSQTTRATNCATPRSYNLSIIIHKRCGRQVPARQKSYSQAEQPQHQQVRGVEGIEEPLVKRAPAGGAPAIVQVQDHKRGDKDRHNAADGLPHLPAAQPGHAAVEQRRRAERGFLPRSYKSNFLTRDYTD